MSDTRISQLPSPPAALSGTEIIPIVQNGVTYASTLQSIANLFTISNGSFVNITYSGLLTGGSGINYTDTGVLAAIGSSPNSYNQIILQNKNNGTAASANYNVSNDVATSSTNYGEFGINSSGFTGTGPFNQPGNVYAAAASTDMVVGTYSAANYYRVSIGPTNAIDAITAGANGARPGYTNSTTVTATGTFTFNPQTYGQIAKVTLTNTITVTFGAPTNIFEGAMYKFMLYAGDGNTRTYAWNTAYKFPSAVSPLLAGTTTSGAVDIITFIGGPSNTLIYDGYTSNVR